MRLIDLDSLIVEFEKRCRGECCCCTEDYCGSGNDGCGCRVIDEAPTVDAEPVVRCKDCECWGTRLRTIDNDGNTVSCDCLALDGMTKADFYCAWGKRKDEVTE